MITRVSKYWASFPFYKQLDSMDCGPSCLRMIAKYYGKEVSLQNLRNTSESGKDGVNLLGVSRAAENIGFDSLSVKLTLARLLEFSNLPVILHWNQNHFVVLYKIAGNRLYIADPGKGLMKYRLDDFRSNWVS